MDFMLGSSGPLNGVDALLAAIVLVGIWLGWRRGFLLGAAELLTLAGALLAAVEGWRPLAAALHRHRFIADPWAAPTAFVLILVLASLALGWVVQRLVRRLPHRAHVHGANRLLGVLPGAVSGLFHATVVGMALLAIPLGGWLSGTVEAARTSLSARWLDPVADGVEAQLGPIVDPLLGEARGPVRIDPAAAALAKLPFTVQAPVPRPELEATMLALVNAERAKEGLRPLVADPEALEMSRAHSRDMFVRGYFAHVTPDGLRPVDRLRAAGLRFIAAGENLALAPTLAIAHEGLMNSPGHRANILQPAYGRLAIGIESGGRHGLMVTQTFRN